MKKNGMVYCVALGAVALGFGCLCHRFAPGFGLVLMPMFWPLAFLATRVSMGKAVATAAIVPFVSMVLTGMPTLPFVVAVKFAVFAALANLAWRLCSSLRNR